MKEIGYLKRLEEQLDRADISYILFDKIVPNPIKEHVMEGADIVKKEKCDFIIGMGKKKSIPNDPLPVIAISTTSGTGTEADPWMVITNGKEKVGFGYDKTFPYLSIVDPELMKSIPTKLTAYQGFDALFHSAEGYINKIANEMSDLFALKSIELIGKSLAKAVANGGRCFLFYYFYRLKKRNYKNSLA